MLIIHFLPVEKYPPVTNFVNYLNEKGCEGVTIITTKNTSNKYEYSCENTKIIRFPSVSSHNHLRYLSYLWFYIGAIFCLFLLRPKKVLWYETLASFPVIVYYKLCLIKPKLYIHYHEYMSLDEIKNGMRLVKWFHALEKRIYPKLSWFSHTNNFRLELFLNENKNIDKTITHILPNYPPQKWGLIAKKEMQDPLRLVYVGSFASTETIFIKEIVAWLRINSLDITLDIYSFEIPEEIALLCKVNNIKIHEPLSYQLIPQVINTYDVGLILYKGHIPNYIYNAPNKLFEYLACGLDVWFPKQMIGTLEFTRLDCYPKVVPVDFEKLDDFDWRQAVNRDNVPGKPVSFFCETVYEELYLHTLK